MSTLPLIEAILLEIHQSLGCSGKQATKKKKFKTGQDSLLAHKAMGENVLDEIFTALDMDPRARLDAIDNLTEFGNALKSLELSTWTFAADSRQILWMQLGYFCMPGLARYAAFWNMPNALDTGMPGGRFWYLPEPREVNGKPDLYLPVAQVVDWLLDLLGMPLEELADQRSERSDGGHDGLRRSLYNWRRETTPNPNSFKKYFSDQVSLDFKGCFVPDDSRPAAEQFADALAFVAGKQLTADRLRREIPMTQAGRLEAVLDGSASDDERAFFADCLAARYAVPHPRTIRQRLLVARMVQDGYVRLLKFLCPGVDRLCADARQNKLLQLFAIYQFVYNLTIDAWRDGESQGEDVENAYFEERLPPWDRHGLFLSILPSCRETANLELARLLTHHFHGAQAGADLEDHVALDEASAASIIKRNVERQVAMADELTAELKLVERVKHASPWRALQGEHRYWVISQVAQHADLRPRAKEAAIQRLRELAATPTQTIWAILLELDGYLNGERKHRPKDSPMRVQAMLHAAEANEGYKLWEAPILQYKAKHLLASNDFDGAGKLFRQALEASLECNFGPVRGEIARDCLAVEVANRKLIPNNHEKYYREMLAGGVVEGDEIPRIEDTARWAAEYFWDNLYKPYPGLERKAPLALARVEESTKLLLSGDLERLLAWMEQNSKALGSQLPLVTGDSLLMVWIKGYNSLLRKLPLTWQALPEPQNGLPPFESVLAHWHQAIGLLAKKAPKQLHVADFKGQTPLMLVAEAGGAELVGSMLQAGADLDMQDWHGMTALHSAIKSRVDSCVDALLDHPCRLSLLTCDGRSPLHTAGWTANLHATRRLLQMAPELAWQQDANGMTPLELVEHLTASPPALQALAEELGKNGKSCATKQELEAVANLLERAMPAVNI